MMLDGLIFSCDGWSPALAASGLSGMHVTVSDFLGDFARTCEGIANWDAILDREGESLYKVIDSVGLRQLGRRPGIGVIYGLQNALPVGTDIDRVEQLWQLGVRVLQLTYNTANDVADGCLEERNAGLTNFGKQLVRECNRVGMVIDLSHVGERACLETVELSDSPVVATHVNIRELAPSVRNHREKTLIAIAESGGVVGVSPYGPMCWDGRPARRPSTEDFLRQLRRAVELVGIDKVAIGTDYGVAKDMTWISHVLSRSVKRFPEIFQEYAEAFGNSLDARYCSGVASVAAWADFPQLLLDDGFERDEVAKIVGANLAGCFGEIWGLRQTGAAL
jgi:membrane dipeptidase